MMTPSDTHLSGTTLYADEAARWKAMRSRDAGANGSFYFAVLTTGVYCLPSCAARPPLRENISFYDTPAEAEKAGYRPCKRCKPLLPPLAERHALVAAAACKQIDEAEEEPSLKVLADAADMSPHYFNRLFKKAIGVTPKQYALARRSEKMKQKLQSGDAVTDAIYSAGYGTASRFYETAESRMGMTASNYKAGGQGAKICYATGVSWLGPVLIAATEKGICSILFGNDDAGLVADLRTRFDKATLEPAEPGSDFDRWLVQTLAFIEQPSHGLDLPLDVQGTAFQEQVWRALKEIPAGETASYTEVAARIGNPKSHRAVAKACGANPAAIAIPCHRVVRADGGLSGYRWGVERKRKLLARERS
ncbi:MAG: bifunctional DNA-binding transcriptional regulator/O6-methylguanine-DNA methyltransferase Ada [Kordiimonadales bacterium]|nr:MAG: bifunctional DNA-binding transcriptional regulator/O6-methylguanine-DNA methyltransferase Ada [Kordiimonadales bacterium]